MTNAQAFRAATAPGSRLLTVDHWQEKLIGSVREITKGTTVKDGRVISADGTVMYSTFRMEMPKASAITMTDRGSFIIDLGRGRHAEFLPIA